MKSVVLETERLVLDQPTASDIPLIFEYCQDALIQEYTTVPVPYKLTHATSFVSEVAAAGWLGGKEPTWAIRKKGESTLLGVISLRTWEPGNAMIGHWLGKPWRGNGYVPEAVAAVVDFGLNGDWSIGGRPARIETVLWETLSTNTGSIRAAWKSGFRFVNERSDDILVFGQFEPSVLAEFARGDSPEPKEWPRELLEGARH